MSADSRHERLKSYHFGLGAGSPLRFSVVSAACFKERLKPQKGYDAGTRIAPPQTDCLMPTTHAVSLVGASIATSKVSTSVWKETSILSGKLISLFATAPNYYGKAEQASPEDDEGSRLGHGRCPIAK